MRGGKPARKKKILAVCGAALAVGLSLLSIRNAFVSAVALEQQARCGAAEHQHSTACYEGDRLVCGCKEHTHNRNCYLVLLKDNDINSLLSYVGSDKSHNLETLIYQTVGTALYYQEDLEAVTTGTGPYLSGTALPSAETAMTQSASSSQDMDISTLNETISEKAIEPNLVLNEDLYNASAVSIVPGDTAAALGSTAGGVSTLAVGDTAQTGNNNANFYVYLDDEWQCIGTLEFEVSQSGSWLRPQYTARVSTTAVVDLINSSLETGFTRSDFDLRYSTSESFASSSEVTINSTYTSFGTVNNYNTAYNAKYVYVVDSGGDPMAFYTVTYDYPDGTEDESFYVPAGTSVTLPSEYDWTSGSASYSGGDTVPITAKTTFTADTAGTVRCTVTYQYPNGAVQTRTVAVGTQITLPAGYTWTSGGNTYNGGDTVTVNGDITFTGTAQTSETTIRIRYDLNFSGSGVEEAPAIVGGSEEQTVAPGTSATIRTVSPRDPSRIPSGWGGSSVATAYYFVDWTVTTPGGETIHISPGVHLTAQQLAQYADENGVVQLTGNWSSGTANQTSTRNRVVTFFMGLRSEAPDYGENAGPAASPDGYTDCIYTAYMGNPPATSFYITDETPDNSYNVDKKIRALVGEKSDQLWISSMPTDEAVFEALKPYAQRGQLSADGEVVDPEELTSEYYAIRWYVLKFDSGGTSNDNGWHIDGRLVKKEGTIRVTKTFLCEAEVLAAAQNGFYIQALYDDPDSTSDDRSVIMHLGNGTVNTGSAEALTPTAVNGTTYEWHIKHVGVRQEWAITEHIVNAANSPALTDYTVYSEYSLFDSSGLNESAQAEYGSELSVIGVTQAVDEGEQHMLRVDFTNYYLRKDAIALKKEDGSSGAGLPGVRFEMYHLSMDTPLKFTGTPGSYTKDDNGSITQLETDDSGYIAISGFSYDRDLVVFREVAPPSGYSRAPDITLQGSGTEDDLEVQIIKVGDKDAAAMDPEDLDATAEFHSAEQVLVIKDYSVEETSVTVRKEWAVSEALQADTVTVELYANGQLASNVVPGLSPVSVALTRAEDYTYTWNDLPAYVNGSEVTWSVYETAVGAEKRTVNGEFVNWVDSYDPPAYTYVEGQLVNTELVIRNDARRTMLKILKTNEEGTKVLPGAQFRLVSLNSSLVSNGTYYQTLTTDENGRLTFDNLTAGYYLLSETAPPESYEATMQDTCLYIDASGTVQKARLVGGTVERTELTDNPVYQSAFTLQVKDRLIAYEMPETGGSGVYTIPGALMTLLAGCGYILLKTQKRGRRQAGA